MGNVYHCELSAAEALLVVTLCLDACVALEEELTDAQVSGDVVRLATTLMKMDTLRSVARRYIDPLCLDEAKDLIARMEALAREDERAQEEPQARSAGGAEDVTPGREVWN